MRKKIKMRINTMIDMEETIIRLRIKHESDNMYRLQMLANFRPNASLRQINNQRKLNL